MPTVLMIFGLRVVIYPNDHRPAHVHVMGNGCEAVFYLSGDNGLPELRENYGFDSKTLRRVFTALEAHRVELIVQWEVIHGTDR